MIIKAVAAAAALACAIALSPVANAQTATLDKLTKIAKNECAKCLVIETSPTSVTALTPTGHRGIVVKLQRKAGIDYLLVFSDAVETANRICRGQPVSAEMLKTRENEAGNLEGAFFMTCKNGLKVYFRMTFAPGKGAWIEIWNLVDPSKEAA